MVENMSKPSFTQSANKIEQIGKNNVRTIKEFLRERRKLQNDLKKTTAYLEEQLKNKSLSKDHYQRQLDLVLTSHESTRVEMLDLLMHYLER